MTSGRWGESWSGRTTCGLSNPQRNHVKSDAMVTAVVDIMHKAVFEEEFPLLGAEDKQGGSESGRVLSSGSSTSSHSLLTDTSAVIVSSGLTSALHEIPVTIGSNSMAVMLNQHTIFASSSSIAPGTMGPSMAETLAQGPPRSHTPPQAFGEIKGQDSRQRSNIILYIHVHPVILHGVVLQTQIYQR